MSHSRLKARLVGAAVAATGLAVIVIAFSGAARDWPVDWLFRCGARGFSHPCGEGEVPWGLVVVSAIVTLFGLLVACGEMALRRGNVSFRAGLHVGRAGSAGPPAGDTSGSVPPPPPRPAAGDARDAGL